MTTIRCYGRKQVTRIEKEKSFIRNFFDGDVSTNCTKVNYNSCGDESLFSSEESYSENKENIEHGTLYTSTLIQGSKIGASLNKQEEIFEVSISPVKISKVCKKKKVQNVKGKYKKKVAKKQKCGPKTKHIKSIVNSFSKCHQPRWSEISNHNFTIEKYHSNRIIGYKHKKTSKKVKNPSAALYQVYSSTTSPGVVFNKNLNILSESGNNIHHKNKEFETNSISNKSSMHSIHQHSNVICNGINLVNVSNLYNDANDSSGELFTDNSKVIKYFRRSIHNSFSYNQEQNKNINAVIDESTKQTKLKNSKEVSNIFSISEKYCSSTGLKQKEKTLSNQMKEKQKENTILHVVNDNNYNNLPVLISEISNLQNNSKQLSIGGCSKNKTACQENQTHNDSAVVINDYINENMTEPDKSSFSAASPINTSHDLFGDCENFWQNNKSALKDNASSNINMPNKIKVSLNADINSQSHSHSCNEKSNNALNEQDKVVAIIQSNISATSVKTHSSEILNKKYDRYHNYNQRKTAEILSCLLTSKHSSKETGSIELTDKLKKKYYDESHKLSYPKALPNKVNDPSNIGENAVDNLNVFEQSKYKKSSEIIHTNSLCCNSFNESISEPKLAISPNLSHIFQKLKLTDKISTHSKFITSTPVAKNRNNINFMQKNLALSSSNIKSGLSDSLVLVKTPEINKNVHLTNASKTKFSELSVSLKKKSSYSHSLCNSKQLTPSNSKQYVFQTSRSCLLNKSSYVLKPDEEDNEITREKLLQICDQDSVIPFENVYDWSNSKIQKIGEGTYGEVFTICKKKVSSVLKVIPVSHGNATNVYQELKNVLSEVTIAKCLSELRSKKYNQTKNFNKLIKASLVIGLYPSDLIDAWDSFSKVKSTYNSRPDVFEDNQLFVILELEYGGKDLSCFVLRSAVEAESIIKQVAVSLAIAEDEFLFEHRDLHVGNVLVKRNRSKTITYKLRGKEISFASSGVFVTIIDFTLSRLYENGYIFYNDLGNEISLFNQSGDYQFEVYRQMKDKLVNEWHKCSLYSNVLWLKYLCVKMEESDYSRSSTIAHKKALQNISSLKNSFSTCNSTLECLNVCGIAKIDVKQPNLLNSKSTKKSILISRNSTQKSKLSICS